MIIHKFGGSSVGNAERIANVANIVLAEHQKQPFDKEGQTNTSSARLSPGSVVVVSAMSGTTEQLITGGRAAAAGQDAVYREIKAQLLQRHLETAATLLSQSPERFEVCEFIEDRLHDLERLYRSIAVMGEFTIRGCDAVASLGEQLSARILAAVLRERGARAEAISATELIVTDEKFGRANPIQALTNQRLEERLRPLLQRGVIPIITGYIAATERGITTTLGRGGSDYTAAIIGAGLKAQEVWIWSDVNGILTADPNIVSEARTLSELSYTEAAELAYFGAEVLHPKTIRPVTESSIPLRLLNSFCPHAHGTRIVPAPAQQRQVWPAIISASGLSLIAIGTKDDSWTLQNAARALQVLTDAGVDVPLFSQSYSEHRLNLVVRQQNQAHCLNVLCHEFGGDLLPPESGAENSAALPKNGFKTFSLGLKEKVATISVVGFSGYAGQNIVARAFTALGKHGTRVIAVAQAGTGYSASFCIPEEQINSTVRFLHNELCQNRPETPEEAHV